MLCPSCKEDSNKVVDSRLTENGTAVRRRRVCRACGRRFTTKERIEDELRLTVVKTDGQRVPYNRENVLRGIDMACTKLEVSEAELQSLVDVVEGEIFANHDREVSTKAIGTYVGAALRAQYPVPYVRFMSVHRQYDSIEEFIEEITDLRQRVAQDSPSQQSLF